MSRAIDPALTAPHQLSYTYKRSLGPVLGKFFTALRDRQILGARRKDGSVLMPPKEYDPETAEALTELVPVAETGVVKSWAWVSAPRKQQPLQHAFAYALIQLDGAATPMLHVVDAGSAAKMRTGMRVRARWREQTVGAITDIAAFVPEA